MVRRRAGKLAAIAIAVLVASLVWRARRRAGAVASSGVTDDATAFSHDSAAPGEPVAANDALDTDINIDINIDSAGVEHAEIEMVTIDPTGPAAHDADAPVTAARVFLAADAPPVEDDAEPDLVVAEPEHEPEPVLDLARIERDLAGVEAALRRLDDGTYWTDEITGEPIDELVLAADPVARRNP